MMPNSAVTYAQELQLVVRGLQIWEIKIISLIMWYLLFIYLFIRLFQWISLVDLFVLVVLEPIV